MNRRTLFNVFLSFFATIRGESVSPPKDSDRAHYFDWSIHAPRFWSGCAFTTHPHHIGKLGFGPRNVVRLNGKDISHKFIHRFVTGQDGWVEVAKTDEHGNTMYDYSLGVIATETLVGHVTFEDKENPL